MTIWKRRQPKDEAIRGIGKGKGGKYTRQRMERRQAERIWPGMNMQRSTVKCSSGRWHLSNCKRHLVEMVFGNACSSRDNIVSVARRLQSLYCYVMNSPDSIGRKCTYIGVNNSDAAYKRIFKSFCVSAVDKTSKSLHNSVTQWTKMPPRQINRYVYLGE